MKLVVLSYWYFKLHCRYFQDLALPMSSSNSPEYQAQKTFKMVRVVNYLSQIKDVGITFTKIPESILDWTTMEFSMKTLKKFLDFMRFDDCL
ncbi:unnamed protein product [Ambrosiozyma monospora]|uniref:Unnamed protein product n=1 Tax=Ambrosiozyma monospora TaxID=43982 RepID=A0A9W6Z0J8_AMBMO|nr:unnamed protein product [Ambrosiozyma monospora]